MRIVYEDEDVLVVHKEAGLPVQTGRTSAKDLVSLLKNDLAKKNGQEGGAEPYLGIVHRLDQPVEGLLVFAVTPKSAASLSAQAAAKLAAPRGADPEKISARKRSPRAADGGMEKIYQAVVCLDADSYPLAIEGRKREVILTDWLGRDTASNTAFVMTEGEKGAKKAVLSFRTLWIRESRAMLEIRLFTGRHHQIRIQMAHAGMPILGDRKYGTQPCDAGGETVPLCLCATRLSFTHPANRKRMTFATEPSWLPLVSKDANMSAEAASEAAQK